MMRAALTLGLALFASTALADEVADAIANFAAQRGETVEQLSRETGTSPQGMMAFVADRLKLGVKAEITLTSLINVARSLKDPDKLELVECMGVEVYDPPRPKPDAAECDRVKRKFNIPQQ